MVKEESSPRIWKLGLGWKTEVLSMFQIGLSLQDLGSRFAVGEKPAKYGEAQKSVSVTDKSAKQNRSIVRVVARAQLRITRQLSTPGENLTVPPIEYLTAS